MNERIIFNVGMLYYCIISDSLLCGVGAAFLFCFTGALCVDIDEIYCSCVKQVLVHIIVLFPCPSSLTHPLVCLCHSLSLSLSHAHIHTHARTRTHMHMHHTPIQLTYLKLELHNPLLPVLVSTFLLPTYCSSSVDSDPQSFKHISIQLQS